jgi:hypothetical protein
MDIAISQGLLQSPNGLLPMKMATSSNSGSGADADTTQRP